MPRSSSPLDRVREGPRFSVPVRDPVWKHIWLSEGLRDVTLSPAFLRLYRIKQLGPTEYVYPGATHTRASHSLGVYSVALRILRTLLERGADQWTTAQGCDSFLAAALLHDLGHFPFTHALKELPLTEHEALTANLIKEPPLRDLVGLSGADPDMTAAIVDPGPADGNLQDSETLFFQALLSGVLDPDKLDYLNRDAFYCGVPYGLQDTDFVLSRILPHRELGIYLDAESSQAVESVLFSKYLMYRSVYWHRQVRVATGMMKKALYAALTSSTIAPETLYSLDDEGIYRLLETLPHPSARWAAGIREKRFFSIVADIPFDTQNPKLAGLEGLDDRVKAEKGLAEALSRKLGRPVPEDSVIVDVPERISFEIPRTHPSVSADGNGGATVFTPAVVKGFTASLRRLRIAVDPGLADSVRGVQDLSEMLAECSRVR